MLNLVKHKVCIDTAPPLVDAVDVGSAGRVERLDAVLALGTLAVVVRLRGYIHYLSTWFIIFMCNSLSILLFMIIVIIIIFPNFFAFFLCSLILLSRLDVWHFWLFRALTLYNHLLPIVVEHFDSIDWRLLVQKWLQHHQLSFWSWFVKNHGRHRIPVYNNELAIKSNLWWALKWLVANLVYHVKHTFLLSARVKEENHLRRVWAHVTE